MTRNVRGESSGLLPHERRCSSCGLIRKFKRRQTHITWRWHCSGCGTQNGPDPSSRRNILQERIAAAIAAGLASDQPESIAELRLLHTRWVRANLISPSSPYAWWLGTNPLWGWERHWGGLLGPHVQAEPVDEITAFVSLLRRHRAGEEVVPRPPPRPKPTPIEQVPKGPRDEPTIPTAHIDLGSLPQTVKDDVRRLLRINFLDEG